MGLGPLILTLSVLVLVAFAVFKSHAVFGPQRTPTPATTATLVPAPMPTLHPFDKTLPQLLNTTPSLTNPILATASQQPPASTNPPSPDAPPPAPHSASGHPLPPTPAPRRRHRRQRAANHSAAAPPLPPDAPRSRGKRGRPGLYQGDFRWPRQSRSSPVPIARSQWLGPNRQERWLRPGPGPPHLSFQTLRLHRNFTKFTHVWHTSELPAADRIPPILHQIWLGDPAKMPWHILNDARAILGNWTVLFWTEHNLSWVPYNALYQQFRKLSPIQKASDLARYAILYRFGGWYVDADIQLLRRLEPLNSALVEGADCLTVHEGNRQAPLYLANGILGCRPRSAAMKFVLQSLPFRDFKQNDHKCTGPRLIADVHFRDASQPVFTLLPANTFICGNWACPKPTCREELTRYGWHMHLRFVVWEGKEVSSKEQPLYPSCEKHSVPARPFSVAIELPGAPPSPRYANTHGLSGFCATLRRPTIDADAATYVVQVLEAERRAVVMDLDGHCLGSVSLPLSGEHDAVAAATFGPHDTVVFLTQAGNSSALLTWNLTAEGIGRLPLPMETPARAAAWGLHCSAAACLVAGCAACGAAEDPAGRGCIFFQQVSLEDGTTQHTSHVDIRNLTRSSACGRGELLVAEPGHWAFVVLPSAGLLLRVHMGSGQVDWTLRVPGTLPSVAPAEPLHVLSIEAATLAPSTLNPATAGEGATPPALLVAVTLQSPRAGPALVRIVPGRAGTVAATLLVAGVAGPVLGVRYLWSGLALVCSRGSPGANVTLSAWKLDGASPGPQWRLTSRLPYAHPAPFLPTPHLAAADLTPFAPSTPVTVPFVAWAATPAALPAPATLRLSTLDGQVLAERDVVLHQHWQGAAVNVTFWANFSCDLHFLRAILATAAGARGELSIALYCEQLLLETQAWQESLAAYRRGQRRKWGGMGLY